MTHLVPASADPRRPIPDHPGAREDALRAALAVLGAEHARLERLGLDPALERCREQLRYWQFLNALFSLSPPKLGRPGARP